MIVEPTACAVHAAAQVDAGRVALIGSGTLGLLTIAALRQARPEVDLIATAKHPHQRALAAELGADLVVAPGELERAVRSRSGTMRYDNGQLGGGAEAVVDCVGSAESIAQALRIAAPGRHDPRRRHARRHHRRPHPALAARGRAARAPTPTSAPTSTAPSSSCSELDLGRLVTATYPLRRYEDAIAHAADGRRAAAPSRSPSTSGRNERETPSDAPSWVRPRGRPLDPADPLPPRRGVPAREAARRSQPRALPRPSRSTPLEDPDAAIRHALDNPLGDSPPLRALLKPGMKLTIAFDDISLPLPADAPARRAPAGHRGRARPGRRGRRRRRAPDRGARPAPPHDRGRAAPRRRRPRLRRLRARTASSTTTTPRTPTAWPSSARPSQGEEVEINKRAAESDLLVYVNINLVSMDGGWKSTATGLASYRSLRHHHNVQTMQHSRAASWTATRASSTARTGAWARCSATAA